ncbi:MAG: 3-deoxy-D-manno-octulosonic acid transferase [Candidatus Omnitrophica bacterium]|nr:3-deoxy-D-manno-octulosonic acid transferase [Candidatus Omnitrophota bacterium]
MRRFGVIPKGVDFSRPIWIHAVSVGEAVLMRGLIVRLRAAYPSKSFVISTVTPTGNKIAQSIAEKSDFVTYLPFDLSFITSRVIKKVRPCVFIIAETEIWPNLISSLYDLKVPIAVLNARISDKSFKGYLAIKYLLKPILNKIHIFCAQSKNDRDRLISLGVEPGRIEVTASMKFDQARKLSEGVNSPKDKLSLKEGEVLLVAGSTHPGEERILLNIYRKLLGTFPYLRLLLAPRHPDRADKIATLVRHFGFKPCRISLSQPKEALKDTVFILDTVGELITFYAAADIVVVGGSLVKRGGQNILEPASLGKPVIFGPHMFNFRDIAAEFLKSNAALQALTPEDLLSIIKELLGDKPKIIELARNSKEVILNNQGATEKNFNLVRKLIV